MTNKRVNLLGGLIIASYSATIPAADSQRAEAAVAAVLFELDIENASFKVRHDGYVDILFGPALTDARYQSAIAALKAHPEIPGILAGRGASDYCAVP